mgnify:CR=1 FL=1
MRELNNIKIIAVDHGYGNIKTANTVTPTGVTAYETEPIFSGNILEYGGIYYRIGEGHKEFIADKAVDEDYYLLTLMAVARELNVYGISRLYEPSQEGVSHEREYPQHKSSLQSGKGHPEASMAVSSEHGQAAIQILQQCDCRSSGGLL